MKYLLLTVMILSSLGCCGKPASMPDYVYITFYKGDQIVMESTIKTWDCLNSKYPEYNFLRFDDDSNIGGPFDGGSQATHYTWVDKEGNRLGRTINLGEYFIISREKYQEQR